MKKSTLLLLALSLAAPAFAGAPAKNPVVEPAAESTISYSNFGVSWLHTEFDSPGLDDADGVGAALEFALCPMTYVAASGSWQSASTAIGDLDVISASAGVGAHFALCKEADIVVEVGGAYVDADVDDDFGVYVTPHFRVHVGPAELHVGATYTSAFDGEWVGFAAVFVPVADKLDLAVGASLGDEAWGFNVGGRIRF